jgi:hypothetical protein
MYWKFSSISWDSLPLNGIRVKWRHEVKWDLPPRPSSMWRMCRARQYWASGHSGKAGNWGSGRLVVRTVGGNSPRAICSTVEHFHKQFKGAGLRYCSCGYIKHPQTHNPVAWKSVSTFCAPPPGPPPVGVQWKVYYCVTLSPFLFSEQHKTHKCTLWAKRSRISWVLNMVVRTVTTVLKRVNCEHFCL